MMSCIETLLRRPPMTLHDNDNFSLAFRLTGPAAKNGLKTPPRYRVLTFELALVILNYVALFASLACKATILCLALTVREVPMTRPTTIRPTRDGRYLTLGKIRQLPIILVPHPSLPVMTPSADLTFRRKLVYRYLRPELICEKLPRLPMTRLMWSTLLPDLPTSNGTLLCKNLSLICLCSMLRCLTILGESTVLLVLWQVLSTLRNRPKQLLR